MGAGMTTALRVALDISPMLGPPTGIHQATAGLTAALRQRRDVEPSGYILSRRGSRHAGLYPGLALRHSRIPARLCHKAWARLDWPSARSISLPAALIHGTNYTVPPARLPRLVSVYDLTLITHPHWCRSEVRAMAPALRRAVARGAHVHVSSRSSALQASEVLAADPERIHLVALGLEPISGADPEAARRLVGADRYVLALGTTEPRKALTVLPGIIAETRADVRLVVAGPAGSAEPQLLAAVRNSGLGDRFVRLPTVSAATRGDLLSGAAVLAYPSLVEGFGLPPLEAASVGTAVVANSVGALPELIGDEIELIDPGDAAAYAAALVESLQTPVTPSADLQQRLAELDWARSAEAMSALYHRIRDSSAS